ncbi:MAG: DUF2294 domain-containing protein [Candidatus Nitrospinota bacterium M3_3B_026]
MPKKSRGQMEAAVSEALIKFEKEYMGRGPLEAKTYIIEDIVLVRLKGVLTPAERQLVKAEDAPQGLELIKQMRIALLEKGRPLLEAIVKDIVEKKVVSLHTDLSTVTGERVIIFTLDGEPRPERGRRSGERE